MTADRPTFFKAYINPTDEQRIQLGLPPRQTQHVEQGLSEQEIVVNYLAQQGFVPDGIIPAVRIHKFVPTSQGSHLKTRIYYYPGGVKGVHLITSLDEADIPRLGEAIMQEKRLNQQANNTGPLTTEALVFGALSKYVRAMPQRQKETTIYGFNNSLDQTKVYYLPDSKVAYYPTQNTMIEVLGSETKFGAVHSTVVRVDDLLAQI